MLSFTLFILVVNPLLFFTHFVHGIPSKNIQGDLTVLSNRMDELTEKFHRKIESLEAALNVQIKTNEEQSTEIENLKLKVNRLESRLDITHSATFKAQYAELSEIFKKNDTRTREEMIRMAELVKDVGVEWIDRNDILRYGPDALLELCFYYEGDNLLDIIKFFLSSGVDIDHVHQELEGNMFLLLSARSKHHLLDPSQLLDIFKFLISGGIDVNFRRSVDTDAIELLSLIHRIDGNLLDILKLLSSNGVDINNPSNRLGRNILFYLMDNMGGDGTQDVTELIPFLTTLGIEVNHKDVDGKNVFHYVSSCYTKGNVLEIIKLLISVGADINATDNYGNNALMLASSAEPECRNPDFLEIVKLLISSGVDVNQKNNEGENARDIMENNIFDDELKKSAMTLLE